MPASQAQKASTAERRKKAIALRIAGLGYQEIADQLGYADRASAWKDIHRALKKAALEESEQADIMRRQEALRLDRLQAAVWPTAIKGDVKAVEAALKVIDRRVRLFGLDAPSRVSVSAESLGEEILGMLSALAGDGSGDSAS